MAKRKPKNDWSWLVMDLPTEREEDDVAATPCPGRAGMGALAFGVGLLAGVAGLMLWQHYQGEPDQLSQGRPEPQPKVVYVHTPAPEPPRMLQLRELDTQKNSLMMKSAMFWTQHSVDEADDERIAKLLWEIGWPGVRYPGPAQPDDHPSVKQAHLRISSAIMMARAYWGIERTKQAEANLAAAKPTAAEPAKVKQAKAKQAKAKQAEAKPSVAKPVIATQAEAKPTVSKLAVVKPTEAKPDQVQLSAAEPVAPALGELEFGPKLGYVTAPLTAVTLAAELEQPRGASFAAEPPSTDATKIDPTPEPLSAEEIESLTASIPMPGYFFRIPHEFVDFPLTEFAALAVCCAAYQAGIAKGWSHEKAEARGLKFAGSPGVGETYKGLLVQSKWNAGQLYPLREGTLLWLPPINTPAVRDRGRRPQVSFDSQPWPDGSSRLEPPSRVRASSQPNQAA